LFIRNLPYSATEDDLRATFETYGDIAELHLPIDDTGQSRGYAFVLYVVPENAVRALSELDSTIWQGRLIHIMPARTQRTQDDDEDGANDDSKSSYKRDKLAKDRSRTNDNTTSNPIYLRTDTVVGALADRYGVKKSDILDRDASNMAVRVALGETQVIAETREFLVDQGVDTELLEAAGRGDKKIKRSKQIIMIKNLPYDTDPGDLRQMFARHGSLVRFVVPPSKVPLSGDMDNKVTGASNTNSDALVQMSMLLVTRRSTAPGSNPLGVTHIKDVLLSSTAATTATFPN
jgi:multiple RNA-binding domain-containing protein 1